jgi:hypothetical protein
VSPALAVYYWFVVVESITFEESCEEYAVGLPVRYPEFQNLVGSAENESAKTKIGRELRAGCPLEAELIRRG